MQLKSKARVRSAALVIVVMIAGLQFTGVQYSVEPVIRKAAASEPVTVTIDNTNPKQVMHGFGATYSTQVLAGGQDYLTASQRSRSVDALFNQIKIRTGVAPTLIEAPQTGDWWANRRNDNTDPLAINSAGFNSTIGNHFKTKVADLASPAAITEIYPDLRVNLNSWGANPWLIGVRTADYNIFLDEVAEHALAGMVYWRDTYGSEPRFANLFNEPQRGNNELAGGTGQQVVDIIKRVGSRLRSNGFNTVKFVAPSDGSIAGSLSIARDIIADPAARQYVGAIGYHPYPYSSNYTDIATILSTSGAGLPVAVELEDRRQLKELVAPYGIELWMTEVSNGFFDGVARGDVANIDIQSFDALRARSIHIHDELKYTNASSFSGMQSMWSKNANFDHFGSYEIDDNAEDLVIVDQNTDEVKISAMGYAIGHYARWINRGAVRLETTSGDPLVQVSAFRNESQQKAVAVAINNSSTERMVQMNFTGLNLTGQISGERSTSGGAGNYWQPITAITPTSATQFAVTLPAFSITSLSGSYSTQPTPTPSPSPTVTPTPTPSPTPSPTVTPTPTPTPISTPTPAPSPSPTPTPIPTPLTVPTISSFTANPSTIDSGQSSTLSWQVTGATSLSINQDVGAVTGTSRSVVTTSTQTYILTATNGRGSTTRSVTITVRIPTISSFSASPGTINSGESSTLSWQVTGATTVSISPAIGIVTGTSRSVSPTANNTTYTLTATNSSGSKTSTVKIKVR